MQNICSKLYILKLEIFQLYIIQTIYRFIISEAEARYSIVRGANLPRLSTVRPYVQYVVGLAMSSRWQD